MLASFTILPPEFSTGINRLVTVSFSANKSSSDSNVKSFLKPSISFFDITDIFTGNMPETVQEQHLTTSAYSIYRPLAENYIQSELHNKSFASGSFKYTSHNLMTTSVIIFVFIYLFSVRFHLGLTAKTST